MLQVSVLRNNPDWVKKRLAVKNFKQPELVDEIIKLDNIKRDLQTFCEDRKSKINKASQIIGKFKKEGSTKEEFDTILHNINLWKGELDLKKEQLSIVVKQVDDTLVKLPNLPAQEVPLGKTPEENIVVRKGGNIPNLSIDAVPHWDLLDKYKLINFELGNKITGSGFPVYMGKGAKLQRSLIQYFLDFNTAAGYTEYLPPFMVNEASAYATGQLPDKEGQMYHVTEDNLYLIPTAEVPVTNIYRDTIVKEAELPIKMTAYSPCFRREAGSYGKDVRGLNRVHQFEKVEVIQLVEPSKSYEVLEEMVKHVEKLLISLELPYRILLLCGGDMGFASAITYDFEVYSAAQQRWLEVSSVSNFESFQSNRMKCRYKDEAGKMQLVHTLNGSSLALPRIVACLLENNQTADGIHLPKILHTYFGNSIIN